MRKQAIGEAGTIIGQTPAAEERVMVAGTTVTLTVAQPIEDILVPNIVGLTQERAEQRLSQEGLTNIKIAKVDSDSVEEGNVIYTEPKLNSYVSKDSLITVYVSTGPTTTTSESIKMPNVVNLSKDDAVSFGRNPDLQIFILKQRIVRSQRILLFPNQKLRVISLRKMQR